MSNLSGAFKEGYSPFQGRLSFKDFEVKVNSLPIDMWNFVRASLLYQKALQCKKCEPNIAMVLLCSCPDALKVSGKKAKVRTNYRSFYSKYCPSRLKDPPLKYYPKNKPPAKKASFIQAIDYIYSKFRCMYVHEGKGRLEIPPKDMKIIASTLLDSYNGIAYSLDTIKIHNWFEEITFESLYEMLNFFWFL